MTRPLTRAVLMLVALVVVVDVVFVAVYFLADIHSAPDTGKLAFTLLWTIAVLLVVIRGLSRVRAVRSDRSSPNQS